jgi:hypothetical protein
MERRTLLKGIGGAGATAAAGGISWIALTGGAAAADTSLEGASPTAVTTDDGEIQYVAYGGRLRFEWDGLDSEATYGWYKAESRINNGDGWTAWRSHGAGSGKLGDDSGAYEEGETGGWGGSNDSNSGPGTEGFFQFKFGSPYGQKDYAISGNGSDVVAVNNQYNTSQFEVDTDGGKQKTKVQIRKTCRVYDGEPGNGGNIIIEDADKAQFTVTVKNRQAVATTGGEIEGTVGADES